MGIADNKKLRYFIDEELFYIPETQPESVDISDNKEENQKTEKAREAGIISEKTVILISYPADSALPATDRHLLSKILKAVNQSLDDAVILNLKSGEIGDVFLEDYHFENCKIIGFLKSLPEVKSLDQEIEYFKITDLGTSKALFSPPLSNLQEDIKSKKSLWSQLQAFYNLS